MIKFIVSGSSTREKMVLQFRQLSMLIKMGMPAREAVQHLVDNCRSLAARGILIGLLKKMTQKEPPKNITGHHSTYYSDALVLILKQHGHNTQIAGFLEQIADDLEESADFIRKLGRSYTYPIAMVIISFLLVSLYLLFVVPVFEDMFAGFGSSLPTLTAAMISISQFFVENLFYIFSALIVLLLFCFKFKQVFLSFASCLPLSGSFLKNIALFQFTRYLSVMLAIDIPVREAITYASTGISNQYFANKISRFSKSMNDNHQMSSVMRESGLFNDAVIQTVLIGEKTNSLEQALRYVAEFYGKQIHGSPNNHIAILNILVILGIGLFLGAMIISMYLPIFQVTGTVL